MHNASMRFSTFGHIESSTPSPPLPPPPASAHCPTHSMRQLSMSHQHSHHHHYHHLHSSTNPMSNSDEMDNSVGTIGTINSKEKAKKFLMKKDEAAMMTSSRSVAGGESRKSAPDVIIIAGCNTSHWSRSLDWLWLSCEELFWWKSAFGAKSDRTRPLTSRMGSRKWWIFVITCACWKLEIEWNALRVQCCLTIHYDE